LPQFGQSAMRADALLRRVLGAQLQRAQELRGATPERRDEVAVVVVRDLSRAVVELDLLQGRQGPVAFFGERQPSLSELVRCCEPVVVRPRLAQKRPSDEDDARSGEQCADDEREGQIRTAASAYRSASRRCSRASGQSAINDPPRKTSPANQIRFTSGFCRAFRSRLPSRFT
jgi:hypothetical protein